MALDSGQYKDVFDLHYEALYGYANSILKVETFVEDIVQNIFIKLWQNRETVKMDTVKAYLFTAIRNECLNQIKHNGVQATYTQFAINSEGTSENNNPAEHRELQQKMHQLIQQLPEKCGTVFYLCRQQGYSYKEVAATLKISEKTVENHMSKALRILLLGLAEYLVSLFFLFIIKLINL
ncbi:MAG: RNA polymerase sigma-70 factor [Sphingobacteriales bacterium]|nr:RNA polymerase sigma-70 factor [Sphingobacteriales bacterium]